MDHVGERDAHGTWWTEFCRPVAGVYAMFGGAVALGLLIGTLVLR